MQIGIVSSGVYVPRLRIKREEYQKTWGYFSPRGIEEKSVADFDEDSITMGVEAASNALRNGQVNAPEIDAVYFASTSPPYVEKQSASTIATALGCRNDTAALDVTSSTRASTSALLSCMDFVGSGRGKMGLMVAADCPLGHPTDSLEHQLGAGAAAVIVSNNRLGAVIDGSFSLLTESLGERFRRNGESFVRTVDLGRHQELLSDEAVISCVKALMAKLGRSHKDYDWFVLQGLDDARALDLSRKLGFEDSKTTQTMISGKIGDTAAAAPVLALSKVLESVSPKKSLIFCAYGPGAGADALSLVLEREMKPVSGRGFSEQVTDKEYADFATYLKLRRLIARD